MLIVSMGFGQIKVSIESIKKDSVISVKDRSFSGVPIGEYKPDYSDTTMWIQVNYVEGIDDKPIINETLILELNLDTIKKYNTKVYDRIMLRFFSTLQYEELQILAKEAAKERYFGYKKYFK